jgi:multicomponent Na+:H+ antiporter subunit B
MRWIYVGIILTVFIRLAMLPPAAGSVNTGLAELVASEAGVPNSVTGILLRNRLYDTLFELLVFTMTVLGVQHAFSLQEAESKIFSLSDSAMVILARIGAMVSALLFLELALRGHLGPGGGFAAGVAGGTAVGLVTLTGNAHELHDFHKRWHIASLEKTVVLLVLLIGLVLMMFFDPGEEWQTSGPGAIALLNMLVALKVAVGSWTITLLFIRHRGLL